MAFAKRGIAVFCGLAFLAVAAIVRPASADTVSITIDQAALVKVPEQVATIVIGNPLIADVTVQAGGMAVVTGKGFGVTNFIALDRNGATLMEKSILVRSTSDRVVVVYRGVDRETYSCAPDCNRRMMLGDVPAYFTSTLSQIGARNALAQSSAK